MQAEDPSMVMTAAATRIAKAGGPSARCPAELTGGDAEAGGEGPGEVRLAAVAPALGYGGYGQVMQARVGEVIAAPAQPLLADPGGEAQPVAGEKPVQLADRDVAGPGDAVRRQARVPEVGQRIGLELADPRRAARRRAVAVAGHGPQRTGHQIQRDVGERLAGASSAEGHPGAASVRR